jgi:N-acetylneuraminic acid mutarotase
VLQSGRPTNSVYIFEDDHWRRLGDQLTKAREHLAADTDGKGSVYFIAGEQTVNNQKTEFPTVDVVKGNKVSKVGDLPINRGAVAGFWLPPSTACAVGGRNSDGRPVGAVDCVSADGKKVSLPSLPEARFGVAAALFEDRLYAFGGFTADKVASDEATVLSLTGD